MCKNMEKVQLVSSDRRLSTRVIEEEENLKERRFSDVSDIYRIPKKILKELPEKF